MTESVVRNPYNPELHPLLVVISGPSGVGKDSVIQRLEERGYDFHFVVTATSRAPRAGEVDGVDYFFISENAFKAMIRDGELLEHALVYGQYKGVPKQQVRDALSRGLDVIMRLDVQGAQTVKQIAPDAVLIFLSAASEDELCARLQRRGTETLEQLEIRMQLAREELGVLKEFDYVVINHECALDAAVDQVLCIIQAEHSRVCPRCVSL